jgi:hypothetical protein
MSDVSVRSWVEGRIGRDESFLCPFDRRIVRLREVEYIVVRSGRAIGGVEDVEDEVSSLSQFSMRRVPCGCCPHPHETFGHIVGQVESRS